MITYCWTEYDESSVVFVDKCVGGVLLNSECLMSSGLLVQLPIQLNSVVRTLCCRRS